MTSARWIGAALLLGVVLACATPVSPGPAPAQEERVTIITDPPGEVAVVGADTLTNVTPLVALFHRHHSQGDTQDLRIQVLPGRPDECAQFYQFAANELVPDTVKFRMTQCPKSDADFDRVFAVSELQIKPRRLRGPMPNSGYLTASGNPGCVVIEVVIDTAGIPIPQSLRVVKASDPGFVSSARNSILRSVFTPGWFFGRKVRARFLIPIQYAIDQGEGVRSLACTKF